MSLTPGDRLGVYEIVGLLGAGGMGEVFRARDARLNREVAVKVLPASLSGDADRIARLEREAQMLASLNHPNIAAIYGFEEAGGVRGLILELVDGPTLADRIAHGPIPLDEALPIAQQIADALVAAHEQSILHRDLKPANIKVTRDGRVKVLDFGLAKAFDASPVAGNFGRADLSASPTITSPALTIGGVILGTAAYMSPEQAKGKPVDKRTDVWAFGCVLYEMLTGKRAFDGEDVTDTMVSVLSREPDWSALPANTPSSVRRLLARALAKNASHRLRDVGDAVLDISEADESVPVANPTFGTTNRRVERVIWIVVCSLLAAASFFLARRSSVPSDTREMIRFELPVPLKEMGTNSPSVSPNGRYIAFTTNYGVTGDRRQRLFVRGMDWPESRALPGTDGATGMPFWSPDGERIGFFAQGAIKTIGIAEGIPQVVADSPSFADGTWSTNDIIIFSTGVGVLFKVPASGGQGTPVTTLDVTNKEVSHRFPQFLPDGRQFLYVAQPGNITYTGSLDGARPKRVLEADSNTLYAQSGHLLFMRRGALLAQVFDVEQKTLTGDAVPLLQDVGYAPINGRMYASISQNGVLVYRSAMGRSAQLQWVDRKGTLIGAIGEPVSYNHIAISRDGRYAAVAQTDDQRDLWIADLQRGSLTRFTSTAGAESEPQWSHDGRAIAYISTQGGMPRISRKSVSGEEPERILDGIPDPARIEDWSADGRYILFMHRSDIWVMPMFGDNAKPFPYLQTSAGEDEPQLSTDSKWIAYTSDESGVSEVFVRPFPGPGAKVRVSSAGGYQPRWRRDGKEIFYLAEDGHLMTVSMTVGRDGIVPSVARALFRVSVPISGAIDPYAVAPDGQRFLVAAQIDGSGEPPVKVILNWQRLINRPGDRP